MLVLRTKRTIIKEDPKTILANLMGGLPKTYKPILAPAVALQARAMGLDVSDLTPFLHPDDRRGRIADAELLTNRKAIVGIVVRRHRGRLVIRNDEMIRTDDSGLDVHLYYFGSDPGASVLDRVIERSAEALGAEFEDVARFPQGLRELVESEGLLSEPALTPDQIDAVSLLAQPDLRSLATAIRSSSGLLVADLQKQVRAGTARTPAQQRRALEKGGLIEAETVVVCKRSGMQTARAPNRAALETMASAGVRCACGTDVLEETIDEALTATVSCSALLDGSKWLSLLVRRHLIELGVDHDEVFIEQYIGADEIDCLANVYGETVLFELKDSTFSLGHAYSFGAKMGIIRPDISVIVTSEHVDDDVKAHFQRSEAASVDERSFQRPEPARGRMRYIEGLSNLRVALEDLITEINVRSANARFEDLFPGAAIPADVGIALFISRLESGGVGE